MRPSRRRRGLGRLDARAAAARRRRRVGHRRRRPTRAKRLRDAIGGRPGRRQRCRCGGTAPGRATWRSSAAGRATPGLITTRGRALLAQADVVVVDRLAPRALLDELDDDVEVIEAGKAPHAHTLTQAPDRGRARRPGPRRAARRPAQGRRPLRARPRRRGGARLRRRRRPRRGRPGRDLGGRRPGARRDPGDPPRSRPRLHGASPSTTPTSTGTPLAAVEGTLVLLMGVGRLAEAAAALVAAGLAAGDARRRGRGRHAPRSSAPRSPPWPTSPRSPRRAACAPPPSSSSARSSACLRARGPRSVRQSARTPTCRGPGGAREPGPAACRTVDEVVEALRRRGRDAAVGLARSRRARRWLMAVAAAGHGRRRRAVPAGAGVPRARGRPSRLRASARSPTSSVPDGDARRTPGDRALATGWRRPAAPPTTPSSSPPSAPVTRRMRPGLRGRGRRAGRARSASRSSRRTPRPAPTARRQCTSRTSGTTGHRIARRVAVPRTGRAARPCGRRGVAARRRRPSQTPLGAAPCVVDLLVARAATLRGRAG